MEFLSGKLRSLFRVELECASRQRGERKRNGKQKLRRVYKKFVWQLFFRNLAFRKMERQCADWIMKTDYPLEVGFIADLTSKM